MSTLPEPFPMIPAEQIRAEVQADLSQGPYAKDVPPTKRYTLKLDWPASRIRHFIAALQDAPGRTFERGISELQLHAEGDDAQIQTIKLHWTPGYVHGVCKRLLDVATDLENELHFDPEHDYGGHPSRTPEGLKKLEKLAEIYAAVRDIMEYLHIVTLVRIAAPPAREAHDG